MVLADKPGVVRIGVLGAARIVPAALLTPAGECSQAVVVAVACRDPARAAHFAQRHAIPQVHTSYEALLADPGIDAVYNPLPNGLHGYWTIMALQAGKHVLCEKPFTANAEEAVQVAEVARRCQLIVMEAFHYRYHALSQRLLEIISTGELGEVRRIETWMCIPLPVKNIRWDLKLAGGSLMDVGCYAIHLLRTLAGAEPKVRSAHAKLLGAGIDRWLRAQLEFADGRTGTITASMLAWPLLSAGARVTGTRGYLQVFNPYAPQHWHRLQVQTASGQRVEQVPRRPSTYNAQLQAFTAAVLHGEPFPTGLDDAIANMRVIDACYAAAGLPRREPTMNLPCVVR
jgi:predicted dehydrogenase